MSAHFLTRRLAEGVYAAFSTDTMAATCNAGIVDLGDRVVVFDPFLTQVATADLRAEVEALTDRAPAVVVNSHYHSDHIRGTQVFEDALVMGQAAMRELIATKGAEELAADRSNAALQRDAMVRIADGEGATPAARRAAAISARYYQQIVDSVPGTRLILPDLTFDRRLTLYGPGRRLELRTFSGHTASDTIMVLPDDGIAFLGDLLFIGLHPELNDGDPDAWLRSLDEIERLEVPTLVPGHGPLGTAADLNRMREYIRNVQRLAADLVASDRTPAEAKVPVPEAFRNWLFPRFFRQNLQFVYERLLIGT